MRTPIVTVRVTCPRCGTAYTERYLPGCALPEETGPEENYADDCVAASCPDCNHQISMIVVMADPEGATQSTGPGLNR
jgi:hypothetical protein